MRALGTAMQLCSLALVATLGTAMQLCSLALVATQTSGLPFFTAFAFACAVLEVRLKPQAVLLITPDHRTLLRGPGAHALSDLHEVLQGIQSQAEQNKIVACGLTACDT